MKASVLVLLIGTVGLVLSLALFVDTAPQKPQIANSFYAESQALYIWNNFTRATQSRQEASDFEGQRFNQHLAYPGGRERYLYRYDLAKLFHVYVDSSCDCKALTDKQEKYWDWVQEATYEGRQLFNASSPIVYDVWAHNRSFSASTYDRIPKDIPPQRKVLYVNPAVPNTPAILILVESDFPLATSWQITYSVFKPGRPDSSLFNIPSQCPNATRTV